MELTFPVAVYDITRIRRVTYAIILYVAHIRCVTWLGTHTHTHRHTGKMQMVNTSDMGTFSMLNYCIFLTRSINMSENALQSVFCSYHRTIRYNIFCVIEQLLLTRQRQVSSA